MMISKTWSLVKKSMKSWNLKLIQDWLCAEPAFSRHMWNILSTFRYSSTGWVLCTQNQTHKWQNSHNFQILPKKNTSDTLPFIYFTTVYKEILSSITHSSSSRKTYLKPHQKIFPALYSLIKQRPTFKGKARKASSMAQKDADFSSRNTCGCMIIPVTFSQCKEI